MSKLSDWHKQLLAGFAAAVCSIALAVCFLYWQWAPNPAARQEMRHLMSRVQLGDAKPQVQQAFQSGNYQHLKLLNYPDSNLWHVNTPFELGSGNWILYMEFQDSKVAGLRLRIADDMRHRPREAAPSDRILPGRNKVFPEAAS